MGTWTILKEIARLRTNWVTLVGEEWLCDKGKNLEYWRVEKVDSVIVLPIYKSHFLICKPTFRPGVGRHTIDFPGGRVPNGKAPEDIAPLIIERELGIPAASINSLKTINNSKRDINSSFSNQGLGAFVAIINDSVDISLSSQYNYTVDTAGITALLNDLECLQCRSVLLEWNFYNT